MDLRRKQKFKLLPPMCSEWVDKAGLGGLLFGVMSPSGVVVAEWPKAGGGSRRGRKNLP